MTPITSITFWKTGARLLAGLAVSGGILYFLAEGIRHSAGGFQLGDLVSVAGSIPLWALVVALGCQLMQGWLRSIRYHDLLRWDVGAPETGRRRRLLAITFARNMFVDLLPSRLGELMYVWLVRRILGARIANGLTSLGAAFIFDLIALVLLILGVVALGVLGAGSQMPPVAWVLLLGVAVSAGTWAVFFLFPWLMRRTLSWRAERFRRGWMARLHAGLEDVQACIELIKQRGQLLRVTLLSLLIRLFKYGGIVTLLLVILDRSFTPVEWSQVTGVLMGVVAGEAAASLPLPTFMSFGTYEAGGSLTLVGMGFSLQAAAISMFVVHLFSQLVDYSLGAFSLLIAWLAGWMQSPSQERAPAGPWRRVDIVLVFCVGLGIVAASVLAYELQKVHSESGSSSFDIPALDPETDRGHAPVDDAERTTVGAADESRKPAGLPASGFAVWTSNRFGSHEIVRFDFVSGQLDRLTETPGKEYYVSVSPDGTRLVYAYAEAPGHSFRNLTGWSVVVKDLQSGITRRVAEEGFHPAWAGSSRYLTYSRGANEVVLHDLETDSVETLIRAGSNGIPSGFQFWTPSYDPSSGALAVTIRGSRRTKMLYYPKREKAAIEMPDGCQLSWIPSGKRLVYTADGNRGGNTFVTVRPDGNDAQVLLELGTAYNHLYFPRFSGDGNWLIYAASAGGHEHDQADYEVFLWRVGTAPEHIQRLSADPGNDAWPALYVPST